MKKSFPGYYEYSEEDKKNIWSKGFFVFDTCVLLNTYCLSSQATFFLNILRDLKNRIYIPYQIAEEYHKNLFKKIHEQYDFYQGIDDFTKKLTHNLKDGNHQALFSEEERESILSSLAKIQGKIHSVKSNNYYSNIRDGIASLLEGVIGPIPDEKTLIDWKQEGEFRFKKCIPPGYKDRNKNNDNQYGDLFVWKDLILRAKKQQTPFIFVTEDNKSDWFIKNQGKAHPAPFLINEFMLATNQKILIYSLAEFLKGYETYVSEPQIGLKLLRQMILTNLRNRQREENTQGENPRLGDTLHDGETNSTLEQNEK